MSTRLPPTLPPYLEDGEPEPDKSEAGPSRRGIVIAAVAAPVVAAVGFATAYYGIKRYNRKKAEREQKEAAATAAEGVPNTIDTPEYIELLRHYITTEPQWQVPAAQLPQAVAENVRRCATRHVDRRIDDFVKINPLLPAKEQEKNRITEREKSINMVGAQFQRQVVDEILLHPQHVSNHRHSVRVASIQRDVPRALLELQPFVDNLARAEARMTRAAVEKKDHHLMPTEEARVTYQRGRLQEAVRLARQGDMIFLRNRLHDLPQIPPAVALGNPPPEVAARVQLPPPPPELNPNEQRNQPQTAAEYNTAQRALEQAIRVYDVAIQPAALEQRFRQHREQMAAPRPGGAAR